MFPHVVAPRDFRLQLEGADLALQLLVLRRPRFGLLGLDLANVAVGHQLAALRTSRRRMSLFVPGQLKHEQQRSFTHLCYLHQSLLLPFQEEELDVAVVVGVVEQRTIDCRLLSDQRV